MGSFRNTSVSLSFQLVTTEISGLANGLGVVGRGGSRTRQVHRRHDTPSSAGRLTKVVTGLVSASISNHSITNANTITCLTNPRSWTRDRQLPVAVQLAPPPLALPCTDFHCSQLYARPQQVAPRNCYSLTYNRRNSSLLYYRWCATAMGCPGAVAAASHRSLHRQRQLSIATVFSHSAVRMHQRRDSLTNSQAAPMNQRNTLQDNSIQADSIRYRGEPCPPDSQPYRAS